ncbi:MAG: ADP-glyceromanno-heptose 6-epimerase [Crocinitomicaceae bacterium]
MIVVTGAAGFIGSYLCEVLNAKGFNNLILVDDFSKQEKLSNHENLNSYLKIERSKFISWLDTTEEPIDFIFHFGARTDTTEFKWEILEELNLTYSKAIWQLCTSKNIPLVYASSAATYGNGEFGYDDNTEILDKLVPLNPYGDSKNEFDKWVIKQNIHPPFWAGLKFFNVYGPREYHKGRMASVIFHAFNQIQEKGELKLFRSHNPEYTDGGQLRDFIYVKDIANVCLFLLNEKPTSSIYNLGSGKARTFLDLALATFTALDKSPNISFIDTPEDIRDKYQYFTEANMSKLIAAGYTSPFTTLENGVMDYVQNYLLKRF